MAIPGKGEGEGEGRGQGYKVSPARPAGERPVRLVDDLHCDDNTRH
jgi:hypothetical protein